MYVTPSNPVQCTYGYLSYHTNSISNLSQVLFPSERKESWHFYIPKASCQEYIHFLQIFCIPRVQRREGEDSAHKMRGNYKLRFNASGSTRPKPPTVHSWRRPAACLTSHSFSEPRVQRVNEPHRHVRQLLAPLRHSWRPRKFLRPAPSVALSGRRCVDRLLWLQWLCGGGERVGSSKQ